MSKAKCIDSRSLAVRVLMFLYRGPLRVMGGSPANLTERQQHLQHRKYPEPSATHTSWQEEAFRWWSGQWKAKPHERLHGELSPILRGPSVLSFGYIENVGPSDLEEPKLEL